MTIVHCIFCKNLINPFPPPPEHIIPENIGGKLVLYNICEICNKKMGSEVDAELIEQRHIFDTFKKIDKNKRPNLDFQFKSAFYHDKNGNKIRLSRRYKDSRISPTRVSPGRIIMDQNDRKTLNQNIKALVNKLNLGKNVFKQIIREIDDFREISKDGDIYRNDKYGITIECTQSKNLVATNLMSGKTPHRFLAKACIEFAYGLRLDKKIRNIETLREHALKGGLENTSVKIWEEVRTQSEAKPLHIIKYTHNQFHFYFFQKYVAGLSISWIGKPTPITVVHDICSGDLLECDVDEGSSQGLADKNKKIKLKGSSSNHFK